MTIEALNEAIIRLTTKRKQTPHTDLEEHNRINKKLEKLYNVKYDYYKTLTQEAK